MRLKYSHSRKRLVQHIASAALFGRKVIRQLGRSRPRRTHLNAKVHYEVVKYHTRKLANHS
jgi:hypothetical protein